MTSQIRVLYLAGLGRNGSTIVSNVLGTAPGLFPVGEVRSIWSHGYTNGALCGCADPIPSCTVWSKVAAQIGGVDETRARHIAGLHKRLVKLRNVRTLVKGGVPDGLDAEYAEYLDLMGQFYRAVHDVTGDDVIVDSSKAPAYAAILQQLPDADVRVVHMVRDARASAYSWTREKRHTDLEGFVMARYSPAKTARLWNGWNLGSEALRRGSYMRVRYEDFAASPRAFIQSLLAFADLGDRAPAWVGERSIDIGIHHMVHGNPSRERRGPIELRPDDEWKTALDRRAATQVTALTLPLQRRYGYPLRVPD